jgi:hypothetical protein
MRQDPRVEWRTWRSSGTRSARSEPSLAPLGRSSLFAVALGALRSDREARKRDLREAQARKIAAWIDSYSMPAGSPVATGVATAVLLNASDSPVYHVIVWLVVSYGPGPGTGEEVGDREDWRPAAIDLLPPGRSSAALPWFGGGMHMRTGIEIAFTDSAGRHWIRRVDGRLDESRVPPVRRYKIVEPVEWDAPGRASSS